jgi:hypothetical protein
MVAFLLSGGAAHAGGSGTLEGVNTVDYQTIQGFSTGVYGDEVAACGNGNNTLTVKVQQQKSGGGWDTLDTIAVTPGNTNSGQFTVTDLRSGTENIRYRFSRKIGTQSIDYAYEHSYLVLSHETPACD